MRRILSFTADVFNIGDADLVIGPPGTSGVRRDVCGQPYLGNGLLYELLAEDGSVAVSRDGRLSPGCFDNEELAPWTFFGTPEIPSETRFGCDLLGLEHGVFEPIVEDDKCWGLDVTGLRPGNYTLRITINPDHTLPEKNYENNRWEAPLRIDPLAACVPPFLARECGWLQSPPANCTPGSRVVVGCAECLGGGVSMGNPILRICEGSGACLEGTQYPAEFDGGVCPTADFLCPESGAYTVLSAGLDSYSAMAFELDPTAAFSCRPVAYDLNGLNPIADCASVVVGSGLTRECGWSPALTAACTPGESVTLGCESCQLYPMLRVCAGSEVCRSDGELASNDDVYLDSCPSVTFSCPASGRFGSFVASSIEGDGYACQVIESLPAGVDATP